MKKRSRRGDPGAPRPDRSTEAAGGPLDGSKTLLAILFLVAFSVVWIALSQTTFFVGPSEWDDNLYCSLAAIPRPMPNVASRYFHVWTLRVFNLVLETRRAAGALYPTLLTVGLGWVAFFLGRRMAGLWCGLAAAVLMPFYPALLKYLTVPYCDTSMALWGGLAVLCALVAADAPTARRQTIAVLASGLCCVLSAQCKETGVATLPPVILALWACDRRLKVAALWISGALAGWLLLCALDRMFMDDFWWRWHWTTYFPGKKGGGGGTSSNRMSQHYLQMLLTTDFLAFSLLGVAGAAAAFRRQFAVRCVALWAFSALLFSSLISCRFHGVHALDRYCAALGVPLVILSAYWLVHVWRRPGGDGEDEGRHRPIGLVVAVAITLGVAAYGLLTELTGNIDKSSVRYTFFMMPPALLLLFLAPWLTPGRRLPRIAIVLMLAATAAINVRSTLKYAAYKRNQLRPWVALTEALDEAGANLVKWKLPRKPFSKYRIARRCRTLSKRPPRDLQVREIESLGEVEENEWIFTSPEAWSALKDQGWAPFVKGGQEGVSFVVYRKRH